MALCDRSEPKPPAPRQARIFVVDDNPVVRLGLRLLLSVESDLTVCGEADGAEKAFSQILLLRPDLAVVDLSLKQGNGLELIKRLRRALADLKILVFSMHDEPSCVRAARQAGADQFMPKEEGADRSVRTIRALLLERKAGQGRQASGGRVRSWPKSPVRKAAPAGAERAGAHRAASWNF
jgi:DNA-binding NarL/FixJ family response regulator